MSNYKCIKGYYSLFISAPDPPRVNPDDLKEFQKPVKIKIGKDATFKMSFVGREPMKVQWYHEGEELLEDTNIKIEKSSTHSRLVLTKCRRKSSGEIKIKIKNESGTTEAITHLVVLGLLLTYGIQESFLLLKKCEFSAPSLNYR